MLPKHADLTEQEIDQLIRQHTQARTFGLLGEPRVNVLELNLALDTAAKWDLLRFLVKRAMLALPSSSRALGGILLDVSWIIDALRRNRIFFPFTPGCNVAGSNDARFALHHLL